MKVVDWDIATGKMYVRPYFGSHKLDDTDIGEATVWGRDWFFQFLGLHLYLAVKW